MLSPSALYPVLRLVAIPITPGRMMLWIPQSFSNFIKYISDEACMTPSPNGSKELGYAVFAPDYIRPASSVAEWPMDEMTPDVVRNSLDILSHMFPEHNAISQEEFLALREWLGDKGLWVRHLKILRKSVD